MDLVLSVSKNMDTIFLDKLQDSQFRKLNATIIQGYCINCNLQIGIEPVINPKNIIESIEKLDSIHKKIIVVNQLLPFFKGHLPYIPDSHKPGKSRSGLAGADEFIDLLNQYKNVLLQNLTTSDTVIADKDIPGIISGYGPIKKPILIKQQM